MSGIIGIVDFGGEPVDGSLLRDLTEQMAFRGPDRRETWSEGPVGLGHALLASAFGQENDHQPLSLDGEVRIVADARIDNQAVLIDTLRAKGTTIAPEITDAELILRSYHAWGTDCVAHLMGDFAFAIWDGPRRRLMLARDHFGVVPMYFARRGTRIVFGNTLDVVRKHPEIDAELNDTAVGDFLVFGHSMDLRNTFFKQVEALPPASRIVWNAGVETPCQRYWSLPEPEGYHRVSSPADYASQFKAIFGAAVRDRLRSRRAAIALSGGLDSGAVAAVAAASNREGTSRTELHGYCSGHDWMVPETERFYASLTAKAAGIPMSYISIEKCVFDNKSLWRCSPEPRLSSSRRNSYTEINRRMVAADERILLTGLGGDGVFGRSLLDWKSFLNSGSIMASAQALITYCLELHTLPLRRLGATILRRPTRIDTEVTDFSWLDSQFVRRANLPERARWASRLRREWKSEQQRMSYDPFWASVISLGDPEFSRIPAKPWHPFFDLRVVEFATRIPPLPWLIDKLLLREATRDLLPEAIRTRRKTRGTPGAIQRLVPHGLYSEAEDLAKVDSLAQYVDAKRLLRSVTALGDSSSKRRPGSGYREIELPLSLGFWLKSAFI